MGGKGVLARGLSLVLVLGVAGACGSGPSSARPHVDDLLTGAPSAVEVELSDAPDAPSQVESRTFASAALDRTMRYVVYLPPGYSRSVTRYPVLYMLHGMDGGEDEWRRYGLLDVADTMIRAREIAPLVIVLPQGDRAYWMDHAGSDQEAWGTYTARDVVAEIDSRFRTIPDRRQRAIGGLSMGAHGAVQLALNHPDRFSVVGAHSLVLRRPQQALSFFGNAAEYAARDPMTLVTTRPDAARALALWIDIGDKDQWAPVAARFQSQLQDLWIEHEWHRWPGDHSMTYWRSHLTDYLRFYDRALRSGGRRAAPPGPVLAP
ncbi:MAG: hypothetical protein HYU87_04140 [Chloroflexi bacterium]|nr:hypothetical protein [Chloroflexota bacterium]